MKRKILAQKFLTFALTASVTATMFPTSAFAVTGSQVAADGTYTGAGNVKAAEDDDNEWNEYDISVSVGVQDGNISSISVTPGSTYDEESNSYFNKAKTGNKKKNQPGYESLIGQVATEETINSWDTVSGATRTSTAVKKAALEAIQSASAKEKSKPAEEKYVYCYAGLTWAEYWAAEGVQAAGSTASSSEKDSHNESDKGAFDTVTRATTNHGLHRGSFQCNATIELNDGTKYNLSYWKDKNTFVTTDGQEVTFADIKANIKDYKVTGLKFVPVKVKESDYEAFKAKYTVYENGSELKGGFGENNLKTIDETADVTENTNGLKTVTKNADGSFSFSARATGTDSGVKDTSLKKADVTGTVKAASGSYGEFLRVDFNGNYGDLGANMQAVKWTYYGNDSTRTKALATYGTKFASDNWMHKSMGIQLGLTDSLRCSLPSGYDGTGYWSVTIYALGYEDYTYNFEATAANIVTPQVPADETSKKALSDKVSEADKLNKELYTDKTWSNMQTELKEAKDALAKTDLMQSEAKEALSHLTDAVNNLKSQYVLMNIPYDEFYKADLNNNPVAVDATTSATKQKTRNTLAAGSYHADSEGEHINGVTFPVKVTDDFYDNNKNYTQITDDSKVDITTNIKGKVSTTTYEGKKALFESADYSYYVLSEIPSYYKTATVGTDNKLSFGAVNGAKTQIASDKVTTKFKTKTKYGDYQLNLDGIKDAMGFEDDDVVYGVIVSTDDNTDYAMRHVENIWKTEELAWSVGIVTDSHGCTLSSEHYKSMVGKTIKNVTYYTSKGIFTLPVEYKVLEHAKDAAVEAENAAVSAGKANLDVALPGDFNAEYAVTDAKGNEVKGFKVTEENLASAVSTYAASYTQTKKLVITYPKDAENTEYTLTVSDKSKKYAPITTTFELYAEAVSAAYNNDATAPKLVVADGASAAQFADFIGKIKSVNVNGKAYPATGKGAVKLIKEDGTIDTTQAPFAEGSSFEIKVSATGYKDELSFTYEKPVVIDTKALESAIEKADTIKEADYTADSWKTFSQVLSSAKAVLKQKDDQTKIDNAAESLNKAIEGLKKKEAVNPGTPGSGAGSTGAISGGTGSSNGADTKAAVATGSKSNSTTTDTTGTAAKKATVKKASKTGDTNPLMGMLALAFASISLVGAALFAKKPNRK
ncbi:penicillin-binding Tp47 domain C-containing protein [Agathobacter rectalis]|uniref:penicillin-binding Tp47 domain C-containing protein n=1 Tax=Agathobacter rectalis TaxID=39491 RepID=UPI0034A17543